MALLKQIELNTGVQVEYWRITQQIYDYETKEEIVLLSGYLDKSERDSGSKPVTEFKIQIPKIKVEEKEVNTDVEKEIDSIRTTTYEVIKEMVEEVSEESTTNQDKILLKLKGIQDI